jgi:hypothetical protein
MITGNWQLLALAGVGLLFFCFVLGMIDCRMEAQKYKEEQCQRRQALKKN